MAKKTTLENLDSEIQKILDEYKDEVESHMDEIVVRVGKKGVQALKNESLSRFPDSKMHKKRYGQTWTYAVDKKRLYTEVIIYNKQAWLPHLLENGHAIVSGGRKKGKVNAYKHIEPIAEKLERDFEMEVINGL